MDTNCIAWAAGLYEGEGNINGTTRGTAVCISMTDLEPLQRIQELFGGHLRGPYDRPEDRRKPYYRWKLSDWAGVQAFCLAVKPWLSPRRIKQIDDAFSVRVIRKRSPGVVNRWPADAECPSEPIATQAFYRRHMKRGETPCEVCRLSKNMYVREARVRLEWASRGLTC